MILSQNSKFKSQDLQRTKDENTKEVGARIRKNKKETLRLIIEK